MTGKKAEVGAVAVADVLRVVACSPLRSAVRVLRPTGSRFEWVELAVDPTGRTGRHDRVLWRWGRLLVLRGAVPGEVGSPDGLGSGDRELARINLPPWTRGVGQAHITDVRGFDVTDEGTAVPAALREHAEALRWGYLGPGAIETGWLGDDRSDAGAGLTAAG